MRSTTLEFVEEMKQPIICIDFNEIYNIPVNL